MLKVCDPRHGLVMAAAVLSTAMPSLAAEVIRLQEVPPHQTPVPYSGIRNWHVTQNLGPTGARGWIYGHTAHTRESREILIKSLEPGSPADGVLQPYDLIIGAAVPPDRPSTEWKKAPPIRPFESDARLSLARAITWAESDEGRGELALLRYRGGNTETVVIRLPVLGSYSPTAPFECPKTAVLVKNAVDFVADYTPAEGYSGLPGALNALLLYAGGGDEHLDAVRRSACRMSINHTISDAGHETWRWGYMNLFLCEYYLATGDKRVLPTIREFCEVMAKGQCNPGTWGHRAVPDFIPPGYGSMNQSGLICFLSMVLGRQAGVEVDSRALRNSIGFYGSYAGLGGIPYGDHPPHPNATSNGKNGSAAVVFSQLGAEPAAQWFARLCSSANLAAFEGGHTGNFFNQTWSPLGASLAGRTNYQNFWSRFNSYRDLARRWDGSFMTQPLPQTREGDLGTGNYVRKGPLWSTGGMALSYLAGTRRLAILGRHESVFGGNIPSELQPAVALYDQKEFEACRDAVSPLTLIDDLRLSRLAVQLQTAAQRNINSLAHTLADMNRNLEAGDLYPLKWQLQAIESIIDKGDPRLQPFYAVLNEPESEDILKEGAAYHRAVAKFERAGLLGFEIYTRGSQTSRRWRGELERLAEKSKGAYGTLSRNQLETYPRLSLIPDTPLIQAQSSAKDTKVASWRMEVGPASADEDWILPSFDDSGWLNVNLPDPQVSGKAARRLRCRFHAEDIQKIKSLAVEHNLHGQMDVFLNGTRILSEVRGMRGYKTPILLRPSTLELLHPGTNCLAVELTPARGDEGFILLLNALMPSQADAGNEVAPRSGS